MSKLTSLYMTVNPFTLTNIEDCETTTYDSIDTLMSALVDMKADVYLYDLDKLCDIIVDRFFKMGYKSIPSYQTGQLSHDINDKLKDTFSVVGEITGKNTILIKSRKNTRKKLKIYNVKRMFGGEKLEDIVNSVGEEDEIFGMVLAITELFDRGFDGATLGISAMKELKSVCFGGPKWGFDGFKKHFIPLTPEQDDFIKRSYQGGICYVKPELIGQELEFKGVSFDVNSMYPHIMKNLQIPYGETVRFEGQYIDDGVSPYVVYFQEMNIGKLKLKEGKIPTIRREKDLGYHIEALNLNVVLSDIDIELMYKMYDVEDVEYLGGYMYRSRAGELAPFVDKYMEIKNSATSLFERNLAKKTLNSPYGKFCSKTTYEIWNYKAPTRFTPNVNRCDYISEDCIKTGTSVFSPAGAYITAQARKLLINAIEANWDNFLYCDTDSIYLKGTEAKGIEIDSKKLGAWKMENEFDKMYIVGKKQYIIADKDGNKIKVACAGIDLEAIEKIQKFEEFRIGTVLHYERDGYDENAMKIKIPDRYELKDENIF